jgi:glycosyltransferase involved in cell wall biosynthesis
VRVVIIGVFPFSEAGGGPAARVRNLALGLHRAGVDVEMMFTEGAVKCTSWQQIPVSMIARSATGTKDKRSVWTRVLKQRVHTAAMNAMLAEIERRSHRPDAVIFYNQDVAYALQTLRACRRLGIAFVQQYAELHLASDYPNGRRNTYWLSEQLHLRIIPRLADGSIVISSYLLAAVGQRSTHDPLLIPTIADVPAHQGRTLRLPLTALCVSGGARRDDLEILIAAMVRLKARGGRMRLQIVGLANDALNRLQLLVNDLRLQAHVVLAGHLAYDEFRTTVATADVQILLRTQDRSSVACFPSRLYELFSFGAPVVLSAVGDLPLYFADQREAMLVPPSNAEKLAEVLLWLENHPDKAAAIGRAGNQSARTSFSVDERGHDLARYLNQVCARKAQLALATNP